MRNNGMAMSTIQTNNQKWQIVRILHSAIIIIISRIIIITMMNFQQQLQHLSNCPFSTRERHQGKQWRVAVSSNDFPMCTRCSQDKVVGSFLCTPWGNPYHIQHQHFNAKHELGRKLITPNSNTKLKHQTQQLVNWKKNRLQQKWNKLPRFADIF